MRTPRIAVLKVMPRLLAVWIPVAAALVLCSFIAAPRGGAETPLDKYRSLLEEKLALERENRSLEREAGLAGSRTPYILFDVHHGVLSFRVRGRSFKEYHVKAISSRGWGRRPIAPEALWRRHDGPLTILEKEGGRREIVPPGDEDTGAGGDRRSGDAPPDDAATLGVKAPQDYYIKFEESVIFHVQTERRLTLREKAVERMGEIAAAVRDLWTDNPDDPLVLYLLTDADTARRLYHSILPGEPVYISPPPPTVTLIAAGH